MCSSVLLLVLSTADCWVLKRASIMSAETGDGLWLIKGLKLTGHILIAYRTPNVYTTYPNLAHMLITKSMPFVTDQTVWKSGKDSESYDCCSWGYTFLSRNKCNGGDWGPIQDGGRADMSAPIGSVSLWGVYVYYVYVCEGRLSVLQRRVDDFIPNVESPQ